MKNVLCPTPPPPEKVVSATRCASAGVEVVAKCNLAICSSLEMYVWLASFQILAHWLAETCPYSDWSCFKPGFIAAFILHGRDKRQLKARPVKKIKLTAGRHKASQFSLQARVTLKSASWISSVPHALGPVCTARIRDTHQRVRPISLQHSARSGIQTQS